MSDENGMLPRLATRLAGLLDASAQLLADAPDRATLDVIVAHGEFRPAEDEAIGFWFARFLTLRDNLWTVIDAVRDRLGKPTRAGDGDEELRYFLVGYAAVCVLIRIDRALLSEVACDSLVQRKLNEAFPEYRIPARQYTTIFSAFVDQANVLTIRDGIHVARRHRQELVGLQGDPDVGFIAERLDDLETALNPSKRSHFKRAWAYVSHKWRRRGVVSAERLFAKVLEGFGRAASEMVEMSNKQVTPAVVESIGAFLEPGDVIVTRHAKALTNLFFPGFWPHVALYVGTPGQREQAGISVEPERAARWVRDLCVLEARKDGVLLRPLRDTLTVDAFCVLRPMISKESIAVAVERAMQHEGKRYNFDFNFFTSDRIVCTELVYRAYDGLEGIEFQLRERAGRKTLSAEDLLDFALGGRSFTPAAIFGVADSADAVSYGEAVRPIVASSYRSSLPR